MAARKRKKGLACRTWARHKSKKKRARYAQVEEKDEGGVRDRWRGLAVFLSFEKYETRGIIQCGYMLTKSPWVQ